MENVLTAIIFAVLIGIANVYWNDRVRWSDELNKDANDKLARDNVNTAHQKCWLSSVTAAVTLVILIVSLFVEKPEIVKWLLLFPVIVILVFIASFLFGFWATKERHQQ